jgi:hypothetical protein
MSNDKDLICSGYRYELFHYIPAIILYPALMTPAVICGNQDLDILLIGKEEQPINFTREKDIKKLICRLIG